MDQSLHHRIQRLMSFLESLLLSTQQCKSDLQKNSSEAKILLNGWPVSGDDARPDLLSCQCADSKKQQLTSFLEKVEKAVKYSQSIREGRNDISSPWQDDHENGSSIVDGRKPNSMKGGQHSKNSLAHTKEKNHRGRLVNNLSRRNSHDADNSHKSPAYQSESSEENILICPIHNRAQFEDAQKLKKIPTVGLAEALDVKGIPPELVTVLKSFHFYINRLRTANLKNRAETSFLRNLNSVNETRWEEFPSFSFYFKDLPLPSSSSGKIPTLSDVDESFNSALDSLKKFSFPGIWNPAICGSIPFKAFCLQYQNEELWHSLQIRMQRLQLSQAEWQICALLSIDPFHSNPDLQYSTASLFLKAATALCQVSALNWPILVKTNRNQ